MGKNPQKNKKILLIEDDLSNTEIIRLILTEQQYDVLSLSNNISVEIIKEFSPDLILLDLLLSGISGKVICKQLKADQLLSSTPVILISAVLNLEVITIEVGADDFLAKPFDIYDLISKVKKFLENN